MKKLIIINGTMGVGKSTVCKLLLKQLQPSVYLDGDWCWNMNPFVVSPENKAMVMDNITHLLNSFLNNSGYEYVIFCWVIHQEEIFQQILEPLSRNQKNKFELYKISLICSEAALRKRLELDVKNRLREPEGTERSIARIPLYRKMDTIKIDVSEISPQETAEQIIKLVK